MHRAGRFEGESGPFEDQGNEVSIDSSVNYHENITRCSHDYHIMHQEHINHTHVMNMTRLSHDYHML